MQDKNFYIPIDEGEELKIETIQDAILDNIKKKVKYGIYNCMINVPDEHKFKQMFKENDYHIYTH